MSKNLVTRLEFIEQIAWWEGKVNTAHLVSHFKLSRQAASADINKYIKQRPGNLYYDNSVKGYIPTEEFKPLYKVTTLAKYLSYFKSNTSQDSTIITTCFFEVEAPLRHIAPQLVRPILRAIREKLMVDIGYISLSSPEYLDRIIQPHALIFDGLRWHIRAFCNKNQAFRDFSLSRFNGEAVFEGPADKLAELDDAWNKKLDIIIQPDPRLSPAQQRVIELDYQMVDGKATIPTSAALVNYLLKRLRLDKYQEQPEAQQIIITAECKNTITPYLLKPV